MIKRGRSYTISGDSVTIATDDEYWEYQYDLLDRLIKVKENGITVAEYAYNHRGLRVRREDYKATGYYIFNLNDEVIYEQENGEYTEYIYVRGQHFARRDGSLLSTETTTYFYHTDHLGSTVMVTDIEASIVWSSEYTPFGLLAKQEGDYDFQKAQKFTGKDLDQATGLYYYNARWYYAEIGRFISADSYKGELLNPQTLNLYIYVTNNPLIYVDPTGHFAEQFQKDIQSNMQEYFQEPEMYLGQATESYYDSYLLDIPYPEVGFDNPTLWDNIKFYGPSLAKNTLLAYIALDQNISYAPYGDFISAGWQPIISDRAKKLRVNQIVREWNTPLEPDNIYKMEIISAQRNVYTYTMTDQILDKGTEMALKYYIGAKTMGIGPIFMPSSNVRAGDRRVDMSLQYTMIGEIFGRDSGFRIPNHHRDAPLNNDLYYGRGGRYERSIRLHYRGDEIVSANYEWTYVPKARHGYFDYRRQQNYSISAGDF